MRLRPAGAVVVAVVALAACGASGAARGSLPGFGEAAYRVERDGARHSGCALLAVNETQHNRGLMNVRDLKGHDGMIFQFPADTSVGFYMKDTPMALSIAWFDSQGRFVSSADMAPNQELPHYHATAPYRYALEVPEGKLGPLGIGAGSTLVVGGACPAP